MNWKNILAGMIGALFIAFVSIGVVIWGKPFDYQAIYVINPKTAIADSLKTDTLTINQISVLKDLESKGILLTPQEYTSHITNYYNTLVGFLIGLFILFSFVSFWSIKNTAKKDIEEAKTKMKEEFEKAKETIEKELLDDLRDSKSFSEEITKTIKEDMRDTILTKSDAILVGINTKLKELEDKQTKHSEDIELIYEELELDANSEIDSKSKVEE